MELQTAQRHKEGVTFYEVFIKNKSTSHDLRLSSFDIRFSIYKKYFAYHKSYMVYRISKEPTHFSFNPYVHITGCLR